MLVLNGSIEVGIAMSVLDLTCQKIHHDVGVHPYSRLEHFILHVVVRVMV